MDINEVTLEKLEENPYPIYAELRKSNPIVQLPGIGGEWFVTSWDACSKIGALSGLGSLRGGHPSQIEFFGGDNILTMQGPKHTSLRAGIDVVLRPKHVKEYIEQSALSVIQEYVARIKPRGEAELVSELFEPISVRVVGNRLGLTDIDDETLQRWFKTLSGGLSHFNIDDQHAAEKAARTKESIDSYLKDAVAKLQQNPDGSMLSHIVHSGLPEGAPPRTFDEVITSIRVIILGGFQEPGTAISNTFFGLLTNPNQYVELVLEPEKYAPLALNEGMRWIAPIGTAERTALEDIEIDGIVIPAKSHITLVMASANRDSSRYENADAFDMNRGAQTAAIFGYGEHYCAGNFLAKNLSTAVIIEVAKALPNLRLKEDAQPRATGHLFHSVNALEAEWDIS